MSVAAVVVAGGRGERFGGPKQFSLVGATSVAARSVLAARSVAAPVILVVPSGYDGDGEGADIVVTGGSTRSASVRCGLAEIGDVDVVIVHDAARPLASPELFRAVLDEVLAGAAGAIPAVPVSDTIKLVDGPLPSRVTETLARERLVAVQTPQAFRAEVLVRAHAGDPEATDDAALLEAMGERVVAVLGEPANVKITTPEDLARIVELEGSRS
jgi:2-C-methyl-D-erythritol 4-phosphate cytidylyltransferase